MRDIVQQKPCLLILTVGVIGVGARSVHGLIGNYLTDQFHRRIVLIVVFKLSSDDDVLEQFESLWEVDGQGFAPVFCYCDEYAAKTHGRDGEFWDRFVRGKAEITFGVRQHAATAVWQG